MAWTEITRLKYRRDGLRCASDTTNEDRALVEPSLHAAGRAARRGPSGTRARCPTPRQIPADQYRKFGSQQAKRVTADIHPEQMGQQVRKSRWGERAAVPAVQPLDEWKTNSRRIKKLWS
jgi:hypothetical protein